MHRNFIFSVIALLLPITLLADETEVLFDGTSTDQWEFAKDAWFIDSDGSLTCRMQEIKGRNGTIRTRGMGYIWTRETYADFELQLQYKLSKAANSGVFYRSDPSDPVQKGFEIQLLDNEGFQAAKGPRDPKNLNGSLYDAQAASTKADKPVGQWNSFKLTCRGPKVTVEMNGVVINQGNFDRWQIAGKNPDGSNNKFKTALNELPRKGKIGFQNHGQVVWIKDVLIKPL
ncbi:MAG: DUF1080 domain-containing protein [Rubripirellula sp.]|nr:hypothetical protein [Rhodopirellula sp.]MCH1442127.1 DUF1080 domain-containing protein [Rubripirellula sp.]OUX07522.1 MAG: hypothetical protein CBE00_04675 [Planctomycetaceae bacterium TMED240]